MKSAVLLISNLRYRQIGLSDCHNRSRISLEKFVELNDDYVETKLKIKPKSGCFLIQAREFSLYSCNMCVLFYITERYHW